MTKKHNHYHKSVQGLDTIDVYDVLRLFEVQSHPVGHAIKKLLMAGKRGAKDYGQDLQEAIDSVQREIETVKNIPDDGGWIKWEGGECPIVNNDVFQVKFRDGETCKWNSSVTGIRWHHVGIDSDIIAYRISKTS